MPGEDVRLTNKAGLGIALHVLGWACAMSAGLFSRAPSLAAPALTPTPSPVAQRIQGLISDLGREYAMPPPAWGGAVPTDSLEDMQVFRETCERSACRSAMQDLLKIGKPAAPQLIAALRTAEGRKAEAIAQILGSIGGHEVLYPVFQERCPPGPYFNGHLAY